MRCSHVSQPTFKSKRVGELKLVCEKIKASKVELKEFQGAHGDLSILNGFHLVWNKIVNEFNVGTFIK